MSGCKPRGLRGCVGTTLMLVFPGRAVSYDKFNVKFRYQLINGRRWSRK